MASREARQRADANSRFCYTSRMAISAHDFEDLSVVERLRLVEDIWDSIARSSEELPVLDWHKEELAKRKRRYLENPESAKPWSEVKRAILSSDE